MTRFVTRVLIVKTIAHVQLIMFLMAIRLVDVLFVEMESWILERLVNMMKPT